MKTTKGYWKEEAMSRLFRITELKGQLSAALIDCAERRAQLEGRVSDLEVQLSAAEARVEELEGLNAALRDATHTVDLDPDQFIRWTKIGRDKIVKIQGNRILELTAEIARLREELRIIEYHALVETERQKDELNGIIHWRITAISKHARNALEKTEA